MNENWVWTNGGVQRDKFRCENNRVEVESCWVVRPRWLDVFRTAADTVPFAGPALPRLVRRKLLSLGFGT
jgi:hypothetical protein